ncbi:MAG: lipopolysaccharide biosynthesis protein [Pirellulales bacterium]
MSSTTIFADDEPTSAVATLQDEACALETARLKSTCKNVAAEQVAVEKTSATPHESGLAESVAYLLVLSVLQRIIGLGRGLLVCIWMTPALLGPWDLANRFFFLAAPLIVLGLPGTFGRYLEYYRSRSALRTVLRRTFRTSLLCVGTGCAVMQIFPAFFADLFFGQTTEIAILRLSAGCLVAVTLYNYLTELLNALRLVRANAILQFGNTVAFAALSVVFLAFWRADAWAVIAAYGGACLLGLICGGVYVGRIWRTLPPDTITLPRSELWAKLLPFAAWIWVSNLLTNLLESSTRYMMLHRSGLSDQTEIESMIGNFHAAQLVPNLMITMAAMLGGVLLPHLVRDWENGRRENVSRTMNFALKLMSLGAFVGALCVTWCGPLLFDYVLKGKYPEGLRDPAVNPGRHVLGRDRDGRRGVSVVRERARVGCLALAMGLIVNVGLSSVWLPEFGLSGAVTASACAAFTVLAMLYALSAWHGLRVDKRMLIAAVLPGTLLLGAMPATVMLAATVVIVAWRPSELFDDGERKRIRELANGGSTSCSAAEQAYGRPARKGNRVAATQAVTRTRRSASIRRRRTWLMMPAPRCCMTIYEISTSPTIG